MLVMTGSGGGLNLCCHDLNSVFEFHAEDHLRQCVVAVETAPAFLGSLGKLEDHGERGLVRKAAFGTHRAMADGCEGAFNRVGCTQVLPVLGREVMNRRQGLAILVRHSTAFSYLT